MTAALAVLLLTLPSSAPADSLPIRDPAQVSEVAVRVNPPTVETAVFEHRCPEFDQLLVDLAPAHGWDVYRMSGYMLRESNCTAGVRSRTADSGLLQINDINHPFLRVALGEWVDRWTLLDPVQNVRAAAALCEWWRAGGSSCYRPWGGRG